MAGKEFLIDLSQIDLNRTIADLEAIRRYNPQRYEMEQLTAIVHEDPVGMICVGYKDIGPNEFWIRGHMPGMPLMPGVIMCEAAAQLCSYYAQRHKFLGENMILGFGGLEGVKFRDLVRPGDRLVMAAQMIKTRPNRMIIARFQGYVRGNLVLEGELKGIPLPSDGAIPPPAA